MNADYNFGFDLNNDGIIDSVDSTWNMDDNGIMLQPIHLLRYDALSKQIFILAGLNEGIEIILFANGTWEFYEDD